MMKKKIIIAVSVCSILLFGGCKSVEAGDTVENVLSQKETVENDPAVTGTAPQYEESSDGEIAEEVTKKGAVVIETGPDKKVWDEGSAIFTLHDFELYESPGAASVDSEKINSIDAESYADRSIFLLLQVDIKSIDAKALDEDGSINVSRFCIVPKQVGDMDWEISYPVYVSEAGEGPDFYHVLVNEGETKTITIGFYVPVSDAEELRSKCQISMYGSYDDGYLYEIPEIKQVMEG